MGFEIWTDPILSWVGGAGVIGYAIYIHEDRARSGLEQTLFVLLYCLAALFISRGFYWLTDDQWLQAPSFLPATLLPLALTLFIEALMRRHVPPALKMFVVASTLVAFTLNLVPLVSRDTLWTISKISTLGTFAWLGVIVVRRDRGAHSPMENRLIRGFTASLAFAFLLSTTDFQLGPPWLHFRLGGIGGLIFVYVCVRLTDPEESFVVLLRELFGIALVALVGTGTSVLLIPGAETDLYVAVFFISLAFVLLYTILGRLGGLRRQNRQTSFFRWLLETDTDSVEGLFEALYELPLTEEHILLRGSELDSFGPDIMAKAFDDAHPVWTLSRLRAELAARSVDRDGAERLIGMLEHNQMTHVAWLSNQPYAFLLLNLPQFASSHNPMFEVALLQKYARLLSSG